MTTNTVAGRTALRSYAICFASSVQPTEQAGLPLADLLNKKNEQLNVDGHFHVVIVGNEGSRTSCQAVKNACSRIDFSPYPNFDGIHFEESAGNILSRLRSAGLPGALFTALGICWDQHGIEWLTGEGKRLLAMEAMFFLQKWEWETPRQLWELFRGPLPDDGGGRRPTHLIRVPVRRQSAG